MVVAVRLEGVFGRRSETTFGSEAHTGSQGLRLLLQVAWALNVRQTQELPGVRRDV